MNDDYNNSNSNYNDNDNGYISYDNNNNYYNDGYQDTGIPDESGYSSYDEEEEGDGAIIGKLDLGKIIRNIPRDWGHKADPDYYGSDKINLSNFKFQLLSFFFSSLYMVYYRAYFLFLIAAFIVPCILNFITSALGGLGAVLGPVINIMYSLFLSIGTTELIRWARVKKSLKLEEKGLSDEDVAAKLAPSMKPVIFLILIYLLIVFIIIFSLVMAIVAGLTLANVG